LLVLQNFYGPPAPINASHTGRAVQWGNGWKKKKAPMKDALYIVLMLAIFALSVAFVYALERLKGGSKQ
jgi:hypothetical protein